MSRSTDGDRAVPQETLRADPRDRSREPAEHQAPNIRLSKATGAGPLGDVGVYCINACRYISGEEPVEVTAEAVSAAGRRPRFAEVPRDYVFTMRFPSGVHEHCGVTFGSNSSRRYRATAPTATSTWNAPSAIAARNSRPTSSGRRRSTPSR